MAEDLSKGMSSVFSDLENLELKATVEGQETFIRQLREELRSNGEVREVTSTVERFESGRKTFAFEDKLRDKDMELSRFQEELDASRQSMDSVQRQYAEVKESAKTKDTVVRKLRDEIDGMSERLDEARKEKAVAVEKVNEVQSDLSSLGIENDWLKSQLKLAEKSLKDVGKDSGGAGRRATQKTGSAHSRKESLQELMQLTSEYESLLKSTEPEDTPKAFSGSGDLPDSRSGNQPTDDKFMRDMNKRMQSIEKRVKEAVNTEKYQINAEKEYLIQEFRNLQKTLSQHQRMQQSYAKDVEAKDSLIKRLKSIKASLESEVDELRQELLKVKEQCDRQVKEKHVDNMKLISTKSKVSGTRACGDLSLSLC